MLYSFFDDGAKGFIDRNGRVVISPKFMFIPFYSEGLICFFGGICGNGYIDERGRIYPLSVNFANMFSEGLASVKINKSFGYINKKFDFVIEPRFDNARDFSEGRALVMIDNKYGFIDKWGNAIIELQFDDAKDFSEGLAAVRVDDKWGFVDKNGKLVFDEIYESAESFKKGYAIIKKNDKYGFINKAGKVTAEPRFDYISPYYGYPAAACTEGKYGFIDTSGNFLIEPKFDEAKSFEDGFGALGIDVSEANSEKKKYRWTFIDEKGDFLTDFIFDGVDCFQGNLAVIEIDNCYGVIDRSGNLLLKPEYNTIDIYDDGMIILEKMGKSQFIDTNLGFEIKPIVVTEKDVEYLNDGRTIIWKNYNIKNRVS